MSRTLTAVSLLALGFVFACTQAGCSSTTDAKTTAARSRLDSGVGSISDATTRNTTLLVTAQPGRAAGIADPGDYLAPLAEEMNKTWPNNRAINIVVHGHSVPAGYFRTPRVEKYNSYPHLMGLGLNERYPNAVVNVIVTAIGGEASPAGAARFERDVLSLRPDLLLIDYALNDRGQGLERSERAWREMIESALERGIPVIALTPTADQRADMDDPADPLNRHAALIRDLAEEYGIALVDSYAGFKQYVADGGALRDIMSTGNHPNRRGHDLVAERLLRWFPQ